MLYMANENKKKKGLRRQAIDKYWSSKITIFFVVSVIFVFPETSHAYLDPGTGSFVFQMIIAGVVGGLFAIKTFWRKIVSFFKKDNGK
jgi:hypothetical protein